MVMELVEADEVLDVSGMVCPMPIFRVKHALSKMEAGKILKVIATDLGTQKDIPAWVKHNGDELLGMNEEGSKFIYLIKTRVYL